MCRNKKLKTEKPDDVKNTGAGVYFSADFTKIVKYMMLAGVLITAIIFGTETYQFIINNAKED